VKPRRNLRIAPALFNYVHSDTDHSKRLLALKDLEAKKIREQPKTIAILGTNTVVENALALLLEGEGYSTRIPKISSTTEALVAQEVPSLVGGVDLVVLAPSLSTRECEAFLAARRTSPQRISTTTTSSPTPVIVLRSLMKEAPPL
jgi:hypothetical protein